MVDGHDHAELLSQYERRLANLEARLTDAQRKISEQARTIGHTEGDLAHLRAELADARRKIDEQAQVIGTAEGDLAHLHARLADAQRKIGEQAQTIGDYEDHLAMTENLLEEQRRLRADLMEEEGVDNDTALERLFRRYGLDDLARQVKRNRVRMQAGRERWLSR